MKDHLMFLLIFWSNFERLLEVWNLLTILSPQLQGQAVCV